MSRTYSRLPALIAVFLLAALIVVLIVFLIPKQNGSFSPVCVKARSCVTRFLRAVEKEDYDTAFSYVYCVSEETGEPLDPAVCRAAWINRVKDLREGAANTYLKDHGELSVYLKDGVLCAEVRFTVWRQGFEDKFYGNKNTLRLIDADGWKIASLSGEDRSVQTAWEKALSGVFSAAEAGGAP